MLPIRLELEEVHPRSALRVARDCIQRETWCMGQYAGFNYNLTLCRLKSRLQHIYHGEPYA